MSTSLSNIRMRAGTAGGTLIALLTSWSHDLTKTIVLSAVGAAVSFTISWLLRRLLRRFGE